MHRHTWSHNWSSGTAVCRKGNKKWNRKGELARRTKRPEPSARYHISCHSHTLQSVMSSSVGGKCGFLPGEQQGEDHRSASSQWRSLSRSILCWGKISLRKRNCHGRLWSFRSLTILTYRICNQPLKAVTCVLLRFSSSEKMDWKWPNTGSCCRYKFVVKFWSLHGVCKPHHGIISFSQLITKDLVRTFSSCPVWFTHSANNNPVSGGIWQNLHTSKLYS